MSSNKIIKELIFNAKQKIQVVIVKATMMVNMGCGVQNQKCLLSSF